MAFAFGRPFGQPAPQPLGFARAQPAQGFGAPFGAPPAPFGAAAAQYAAPAAPFRAVPAAAPAFGFRAGAGAGGDIVVPPGDASVPLEEGAETISAISWNADGRRLAASSWDGTVRTWAVDGVSAASLTAKNFAEPVMSAKWNPAEGSSTIAVAGSLSGTVKLWDVTADAAVELGKHDGPVRHVFWAPDQRTVISGSWDRTVRYWDPRSPKEIGATKLSDKVLAMDVSGNAMVVGTADQNLAIFDRAALGEPAPPTRVTQNTLYFQMRSLALCADGGSYVLGGIEGRCSVRWLARDHDEFREGGKTKHAFTFKCHRRDGVAAGAPNSLYSVNAVDAYPGAGHPAVFATGGGDSNWTIWCHAKRQRMKPFALAADAANPNPVTALRFSPNGDRMAYAVGNDFAMGPASMFSAKRTSIHLHPISVAADILGGR